MVFSIPVYTCFLMKHCITYEKWIAVIGFDVWGGKTGGMVGSIVHVVAVLCESNRLLVWSRSRV